VKRLQVGIESTTLANGLKVVIAPDTTVPVVTVGVYYKIGFRLEPQGRSGLRIFEHMMLSFETRRKCSTSNWSIPVAAY
jgi:predicted Zn-dependent peptidase